MSSGESARKHYEAARQEVVERIQARDNVLLFYLGAVGTLFGVALGTSARLEILLVIPYLALGAAVLVSQHHALIGWLAAFCANEIEPFLKEIGEYAPQWDNSLALQEYSSRAIGLRAVGHLVLIVIPSIAGLVMNWRFGFGKLLPQGILWWSGVAFTVLSTWTIRQAHAGRKKIYDSTQWREEGGEQSPDTG
jgi:hypothetical protein